MWIDFSDDTGAFTNLNKMYISDIQGETGTHLLTGLKAFSYCMLIKSRTVLDGQNRLRWIS